MKYPPSLRARWPAYLSSRKAAPALVHSRQNGNVSMLVEPNVNFTQDKRMWCAISLVTQGVCGVVKKMTRSWKQIYAKECNFRRKSLHQGSADVFLGDEPIAMFGDMYFTLCGDRNTSEDAWPDQILRWHSDDQSERWRLRRSVCQGATYLANSWDPVRISILTLRSLVSTCQQKLCLYRTWAFELFSLTDLFRKLAGEARDVCALRLLSGQQTCIWNAVRACSSTFADFALGDLFGKNTRDPACFGDRLSSFYTMYARYIISFFASGCFCVLQEWSVALLVSQSHDLCRKRQRIQREDYCWSSSVCQVHVFITLSASQLGITLIAGYDCWTFYEYWNKCFADCMETLCVQDRFRLHYKHSSWRERLNTFCCLCLSGLGYWKQESRWTCHCTSLWTLNLKNLEHGTQQMDIAPSGMGVNCMVLVKSCTGETHGQIFVRHTTGQVLSCPVCLQEVIVALAFCCGKVKPPVDRQTTSVKSFCRWCQIEEDVFSSGQVCGPVELMLHIPRNTNAAGCVTLWHLCLVFPLRDRASSTLVDARMFETHICAVNGETTTQSSFELSFWKHVDEIWLRVWGRRNGTCSQRRVKHDISWSHQPAGPLQSPAQVEKWSHCCIFRTTSTRYGLSKLHPVWQRYLKVWDAASPSHLDGHLRRRRCVCRHWLMFLFFKPTPSIQLSKLLVCWLSLSRTNMVSVVMRFVIWQWRIKAQLTRTGARGSAKARVCAVLLPS